MQNAKLLSTPALADLARADRLSRKLGRGPVISVPRQWLYIENIHCKKEQSWQNHWVEQLDAFTWALRECLATHWYASKKDDVHDQFCLLLQEICLLAVFPVDVPTEWVFVLGRPEMRGMRADIAHTQLASTGTQEVALPVPLGARISTQPVYRNLSSDPAKRRC